MNERSDDVPVPTGEEAPLPGAEETASVVLHEEQPRFEVEERHTTLTARKRVDARKFEDSFPREVEDVALERVPANEGDSGEVETLADGSLSIPVFEEELVVTRRVVLKERVIIRKETRTEYQKVKSELRRERLEIEADPGVVVDDRRSA